MISSVRVSSLAMTILAGVAACSGVAKGAAAVESERVSGLLSDARIAAFQLKADADELERYTRSKAGWESHTAAVSRIREDVNKMGRILISLDQNRADAASWQQLAIDRVTPVAKELAANTTTVIDHINNQPQRLNFPAYQEYVEAISDSAANLAATIENFVAYGKTRERLDRLAAKLELPNN